MRRNKLPLIVVDPGHGGIDMGAHSKQCTEKSACLATAIQLKEQLLRLGYRVKMTREDDTFIPLKDRAALANSVNSKLFVSVHYNAAKSEKAHGIEVFYYDKGSKDRVQLSKSLAQSVLRKVLSKTGAHSRGIKKGNFCVIRETKMPAILVEGGFITNKHEGRLITDQTYRKRLAKAIAEGIDQYLSSS